MEDKRKQSTNSPSPKETTNNLENTPKLKTLELGAAQGFTCDAETGICGPTKQGKEANQ